MDNQRSLRLEKQIFRFKEGGPTSAHKQGTIHRNRDYALHCMQSVGAKLIEKRYKLLKIFCVVFINHNKLKNHIRIGDLRTWITDCVCWCL